MPAVAENPKRNALDSFTPAGSQGTSRKELMIDPKNREREAMALRGPLLLQLLKT